MNLKLKTWNLKHLVNAFEKKLQLEMKSMGGTNQHSTSVPSFTYLRTISVVILCLD